MIELASTVGAVALALLAVPELPVLEVPDGGVAGDEVEGEVDGEVEGDEVAGDEVAGDEVEDDELEGEDIEGELEVPDEPEESDAPGWVPAPVVDCWAAADPASARPNTAATNTDITLLMTAISLS